MPNGPITAPPNSRGAAELVDLAQIESELAALESRLHGASVALGQAWSSYTDITRQELYSTQEGWRASFVEHMPAMQQTEDETAATAGAIGDRARAIMNALTAAGDHPSLSESEQAAAATRQAFIKEDCERLPVADILSRVQNAVLLGDRPAMYLWARYAEQRLQSRAQPGPETENADTGNARGELAVLVSRIKDQLRPVQVKRVYDRALKVLGDASSLANKAGQRRREERVQAQMREQGYVPWPQ